MRSLALAFVQLDYKHACGLSARVDKTRALLACHQPRQSEPADHEDVLCVAAADSANR